MIVTYNWLKEFVDFNLTPEELAQMLTMLGLEVEGMRTIGSDMDAVIVAQVEEKSQHPNADKLSLCKVNNGREIISVVCGAQNFKSGDKVALAQVGAVLPGDFRIKKSKIRGEESCGMLCSERELGLSAESAGIMVLDPQFQLGIPLFESLGLKDTIFEIGLTPNRADCLSVIGIAREIGAKLGTKVRYPGHGVHEEGPPVVETASVQVEDSVGCPRYMARFVSGCTIGPSPSWMVNRLTAVGMRSINNVVDITNYVLLEYGHPLHAFDYKLLAGGKIVVKRAGEGDTFTTLDGQQRVLSPEDLTICDGEKAVALAGIMGGENSEINDATTDILIESACFEPTMVRRTSKRLGIHTESSHRFERGADIGNLPRALDRAAALMAELAGGTVSMGKIDIYPEPAAPRNIILRLARANQILGLELSGTEVENILRNLEFEVSTAGDGIFSIIVPTFRVDIDREIDLIEEIARLNGYENIPVTMPQVRISSDRPSRRRLLELKIRNLLVSNGLTEIVNYSFINPRSMDKMLLEQDDVRRKMVPILNPLTEDQSVMRTSLLPGLLEVARNNASFRLMDLQLFEMRRIYLEEKGSELPSEPLHVAGLLIGARDRAGWNRSPETADFYDVKGIIENTVAALHLPDVSYNASITENFYHPGKSCGILAGNMQLGTMGELHPAVQETYGFDQPLYYFEIDLEKLVSLFSGTTTVTAPPRFPDTFRDIAMLIDKGMETGVVLDCIRSNRIKELGKVELFDVYTGSHVPEGQKSIAVRIRYCSQERTLTDEEVNRLHQKVIENLKKKINVVVR
ncbi:MAG: phenylalanine--tRNA ligase subunit beta [Geobacteraceae bacterium]|nr:phenylalanine--tRNA ligase subunit beta [Geobacteraceae bacterium]